MQVKIITFVTNFAGKGPGHSAVSVGSTVYTFEDTGGWFDPGSGWKKLDYSSYLADNEHRPALIQTIPAAKYHYVTEYVEKSIKSDDDYGGSGVCSQQVARAVNYALPRSIDFDPFGFDTPKAVYHCARRMGLVSNEEYLWPGKSSINILVYGNVVNNLVMDYPNVIKKMDISR
jgi:hypothetical protein